VELDRTSRLLVALNATPEVTRSLLCRLAFEREWLHGLGADRPEVAGVRKEALKRVRAVLRRADEIAEREAAGAREAHSTIVTITDVRYPRQLLELPQPPPVLYLRGEIPERPAIAMVGSRMADSYGLDVAELFARELAGRGVVIVSGLARGIDSAAHRGALEAEGGLTVAVLGCGIDVAYPRGSARLADRIARAGAVVSEFPMAAPPHKTHFPMRNRLIAALAAGTLVVRAAPRSGSLITARLALELGRDVYAVPGNIFDGRSRGPNALARDGALPVQHPREIFESLPSWMQEQLQPFEEEPRHEPPPPEERLSAVWRVVPRGEAVTVEAIAEATGREIQQVLAILMELELGGWVKRYPGPCFCRSS
jgi:DNA processing protein